MVVYEGGGEYHSIIRFYKIVSLGDPDLRFGLTVANHSPQNNRLGYIKNQGLLNFSTTFINDWYTLNNTGHIFSSGGMYISHDVDTSGKIRLYGK